MKKIGNKVFLMILVFVAIFGINTVVSISTQNRVKQAGLDITDEYIPIDRDLYYTEKHGKRSEIS